MSISQHWDWITLRMNDDIVLASKCDKKLLVLYLCTFVLFEVHADVVVTPSDIVPRLYLNATEQMAASVHALDDLWRAYHQKCNVKSLLRVCILHIRNSMNSLDDKSFLSLPVPPYIRKLLTYRDVAERIYEEWCKEITS